MAHTVTGIDLGSYGVKLVLIEVGFRHTRMVTTFEERVPDGEAPLAERQAMALSAGLARLAPEQTFFVAMPGDQLAIRVLDLPFTDARKIDQVVAFELEGQIVHALDDVVFDHMVVPPAGPSAIGSSVIAVAARIDDVAGWLDDLRVSNVEPRSVFAAPVVYQGLFAGTPAVEGAAPSCKLLLDIGHERTNVCFLQDGKTIFARTVTRGGAALTAAIGRALRCDAARAAEVKHAHGFVGSTARPAQTADEARMDAIMREELAPLLREIRQTIANVRGRTKASLDGLVLTGGTAALRGLREHLQEQLELPAELLASSDTDAADPMDLEPLEGPPAGASAPGADTRFALARAIAWRGARGDRDIDLRRGPFVFKASFSVLRQKATHLAALAAAVLLCVTIDATMAMSRLSSEEEKLQAELKAATTELFGTPRLDGREVARELRKNWKDEMAPLPKATAFDILNEISKRVPSEDIKLDVEDLNIEPKKVYMKGTVASVAALDDLEKKLGEWTDCFEEIKRGRIEEVSGGKRFTFNIPSKCP